MCGGTRNGHKWQHWPSSLSQAPSHPEEPNQPSVSPGNRHLNSYRQPGNLWSFIQTKNSFLKDNQGTFSFWEGRGRMEKGEKKQERKINLKSSGTSQISVTLHRCFHAPIPKCTGLSVCPGCGPVRGTAARPLPAQVTELQFEVAAMGLSSSRSMLELVGCRLL